jgi:hypothetical protein
MCVRWRVWWTGRSMERMNVLLVKRKCLWVGYTRTHTHTHTRTLQSSSQDTTSAGTTLVVNVHKLKLSTATNGNKVEHTCLERRHTTTPGSGVKAVKYSMASMRGGSGRKRANSRSKLVNGVYGWLLASGGQGVVKRLYSGDSIWTVMGGINCSIIILEIGQVFVHGDR